ncbi:MAG: NAD(P)H-binding protein [Candidatus Marinimicrobia bacterium]|nr:NAD(P)H-binding protein [Candidatus Neomarinimicrobiota bacterium]
MKILVTGGTGTLGKKFVEEAEKTGHEIRIFSRKSKSEDSPGGIEWASGDLVTGEGLPQALQGVDAVMHAASNPGMKSKEVDIKGTTNLLTAARDADVDHILYPSIVGIDRIKYFYYQNKEQAEKLIMDSGIPFTILRGTQFHELIDQVFAGLNKVPLVLPVPKKFQLQTIAARDMAQKLAQFLEEGPAGRAPDFAGPEVLNAETMADSWLKANKLEKKLVNLPVWGGVARGFREGKVTNPQRAVGEISWNAWLQRQK